MQHASKYTFLKTRQVLKNKKKSLQQKLEKVQEQQQEEEKEEQKLDLNDHDEDGGLSVHSSSSEDEEGQEADTNVMQFEFKVLKDQKNVTEQKPIQCQKCQGILNKYSKVLEAAEYLKIQQNNILEQSKSQNLTDEERVQMEYQMINQQGMEIGQNQRVWYCEFCGQENKIEKLQIEDIHKEDDITYVLKKGQQNAKLGNGQDNDYSIIFCLDNSGSMSVTTEIKGEKMNLKHGLTEEEYNMLKQFIDEGDELQMMPGQKNDVTYVSRKQCVLAAIEQQLMDISQVNPGRKIGVVSFSDDVVLIGDGHTENPPTIKNETLNNYEEIQKITLEKAEEVVKNSLIESIDKLTNKFSKIEEKGRTALGPALLSSIALAGKGKPGSMVVICTDGLANRGLGSLQGENEEISKEFYNKLGQQAKENGIIISVITIKGEGCKIEVLGKLAEETNGSVTRVDPKDIGKDFAAILEDEIVGTKVQIDIQLHKGFEFRKEEKAFLKEEGSKFVKDIGNATVNTKITLEYQNKSDELLQKEQVDLSQLKKIPFQSKITYTNTNGDQLLRVQTQVQEVTQDKQKAEQEVQQVNVIHNRIAQQSSNYVQLGKFKKAQKYNSKWSHFVTENKTINSIQDNMVHNLNFREDNYQWKKCANKKVSRQRQQLQQENVSSLNDSYSGNNSKKKGSFMNKMKNLFSSKKSKECESFSKCEKVQVQEKNEDDALFSASDNDYSSDEDKDEAMMINFKQGKKFKK